MAELRDSLSPVDAPGIRVSLDWGMHVASLRYFDCNGPFGQAVREAAGASLPERQCATYVAQAKVGELVILAWRSPTETVVLCTDDALVTRLEVEVRTLQEGCIVDLTGGGLVLRAGGTSVADLFARMGGQGVLPALGEARRGRLADLPVLTIQVQSGEILLVVERVYAEHLMNWMRTSATDIEVS